MGCTAAKEEEGEQLYDFMHSRRLFVSYYFVAQGRRAEIRRIEKEQKERKQSTFALTRGRDKWCINGSITKCTEWECTTEISANYRVVRLE